MANPFAQYVDPDAPAPAAAAVPSNPFAQYITQGSATGVGLPASVGTSATGTDYGTIANAAWQAAGPDTWLGIRQVAAQALRGQAIITGSDALKKRAEDWAADLDQEAAASKAKNAPMLATPEGAVGNIIGQVAPAVAAGAFTGGSSLMPRVLGQATAGAVQQFLRPTTPDDTSIFGTGPAATHFGNAVAGFTTGATVAGTLGAFGAIVRAAQPMEGAGNVTASARQQAVDWLTASGANPTLSQRSGSPFAAKVEQFIGMLPGGFGLRATGNAQNSVIQNALDSVTMNAAQGAGGGAALETAEQGRQFIPDDELLKNAPQRIQGLFSTMPDASKPPALKQIMAWFNGGTPNPDLAGLSPAARAQAVAQGVPEMLSSGGPGVGQPMPMTAPPGSRDFNNYQQIRTWIGQQANASAAGSPDELAWKAFRNEVDGAAVRSLQAQGADPAALAAARNAYKVQQILTPAEVPQPDGSWTYDRNKVGAAIQSAWKNNDGRFTTLPRDTQTQLLQIQNVVRSIKAPPTSGTPEGQVARGVATGELLTHELSDAPKQMAKLALTTGVAPWVVNKAMQSTAAGIPGLRSIPPIASQSLASLLTGAGTAAVAPSVNPYAAFGYMPGANRFMPQPPQGQ